MATQADQTTRRSSRATRPASDEPLPVRTMDKETAEEVDFSVVKEMEPVLDGEDYLCTVSKWTFGQATTGQKGRKVDIEFTVTEPTFFEGRKMFRTYSLLPTSLFSLMNVLVALGEDPVKLKAGKMALDPSKYLGSPVVVVAKNEIYEDQERSRPRRVLPASKWEAWEPVVEGEEGKAAAPDKPKF